MLTARSSQALGGLVCLLCSSLTSADPSGVDIDKLKQRFNLKADTELKVEKMINGKIKFGNEEFSIESSDLEPFDLPTTPSTTYSINGVETSDPPPTGLFVSKDDPSILVAFDENGKFLRASQGRGKGKKMLVPVGDGSEFLAEIDDEDTDFDDLNSKFKYGSLPLPDDAAAVQANDYWIGRRRILRNGAKKEGEADTQQPRHLQSCDSFDEIELAIAFDSSFCDLYGGIWGEAKDRVLEIVDGASAFYEKDNVCFQLIVTHIDGFCGHGTEDVYEQMLDSAADISCGPNDGLLQHFMYFWRTHRAAVPRDSAHLLHGRFNPYNKGTIGCAYIGVTCWDDWHYGINEINYTGGTSRQEQLLAHELAYNAGADNDESCSDCIMRPFIASATTFSDQTATSFFEHKSGVTCIGNSLSGTPRCGDGTCDGDETADNCPMDCVICADGTCNGTEDPERCPADCTVVCGDGVCNGEENVETCDADCWIECLDGICSTGEDSITCSEDCGSECGDGACNGDENPVLCSLDCPTTCGDNFCAGDEDPDNCLVDCPPDCGDGVCNGDETDVSCSPDCVICGDTVCNGNEDDVSCPEDCVVCGDDICNGEENAENCAGDCEPVCGDGFCSEEVENASACLDDCPSDCGDGFCTGAETADECPEDCAVCGDGNCNGGETPQTCEADCSYCGDGTCNTYESFSTCDMDCDPVCGNGMCEEGEMLETCPQDCAVCNDGVCTVEGNESLASCQADCASCGDDVCSEGVETLETCPIDCTSCGDGICSNPAETLETCPDDCAMCGDEICTEEVETVESCEADCAVW